MTVPLERVDVEERTSERAEELAQKRFGVSFDVLAPPLQMKTWTDAKVQVQEELNEAAERAVEGRKDFWDELELQRRLGK